MSHLLQTAIDMESKCILSIPFKEVVVPKCRKLLRQSHSYNRQAKQELCRQEIMLKQLCEKLTQKQLQKLQFENQIQMRKQFQKIKKKMRQNAIQRGKQSEVIKCFEGKDQQQSLSALLLSQIQTIQLGTKYQFKIANKLIAMKEVTQIQQNKQKYRSWLDTTNNSPLRNPNYSKMNYVMEKITKEKKNDSIFSKIQLSPNQIKMAQRKQKQFKNKENIFINLKRERFSDKIGISTFSRTSTIGVQYSPKSKVKSFKLKNL